ncbi:MAG: hypothetical protein HYU71_15695 [Bacteroidetes bacterium]|nr:hypothetical protein [Bacteroidota bacterium]
MNEEIQLTERHCLNCDKALDSKMRRDAKFCNTYCRTEFNNKRRYGLHPDVVKVDKILHRNFEILEAALKDKEYVYVKKEKMLRQGFSFDYYTQAKNEYHYCYTLCYKSSDAEKIWIGRGFNSIVKKYDQYNQ